MTGKTITNFGGNIRFAPKHLYAPRTEAEVLAILDRHVGGKVRVVGALHSWSPAVQTDHALIDLRHFDSLEVHRAADNAVSVTVGAGKRIKHLLRDLHARPEVTVPALGLITEQAIGGAISTATHGSGKHSLSHYVDQVRVAAYDPGTGKARVYTWGEGDPELPAARCALGCMGVILSVRFKCIPRYDVAEVMRECDTLDAVLAEEDRFPLQQFFLVPHRWTYLVQRRVAADSLRPRGLKARLFRLWWFLGTDIALHLIIKFLVSVAKSPRLTRWFFRRVVKNLVLKNVTIVDRAELTLVMEHELFRHLETELFVPARHLRAATAFVRATLDVFAGTDTDLSPVPEGEWRDELLRHRATFTFHYPVTFRRVLPDDTILSMTAGVTEPWYAISFITYVEPREPFLALAAFLSKSMAQLFDARAHWGKHFPLDHADVVASYPRLAEFRALCDRVDPHGVFRNPFVSRVLFGESGGS